MDINEQWLLYATAIISIVAIVTTLIMSIVVLVAMKKGIDKVYELFSFLHKESEQRIGKADMVAHEHMVVLEKATMAAEHSAITTERIIDLADRLEKDTLKEISDLKAERNRLVAEKSGSAPKVEYTTHNYR